MKKKSLLELNFHTPESLLRNSPSLRSEERQKIQPNSVSYEEPNLFLHDSINNQFIGNQKGIIPLRFQQKKNQEFNFNHSSPKSWLQAKFSPFDAKNKNINIYFENKFELYHENAPQKLNYDNNVDQNFVRQYHSDESLFFKEEFENNLPFIQERKRILRNEYIKQIIFSFLTIFICFFSCSYPFERPIEIYDNINENPDWNKICFFGSLYGVLTLRIHNFTSNILNIL